MCIRDRVGSENSDGDHGGAGGAFVGAADPGRATAFSAQRSAFSVKAQSNHHRVRREHRGWSGGPRALVAGRYTMSYGGLFRGLSSSALATWLGAPTPGVGLRHGQ